MRYIGIVGKSRSGSGPESWKINLLHGFSMYQKNTSISEIYSVKSLFSFFVRHKKVNRVLITYTQDIWSMLVVFINIFFNLPHIHVVHGDFYAEQASKKGGKKIFWLPVNNFLCTRSDILIVSSFWLKKRLESKREFPSLQVIYNSYDFTADGLKKKGILHDTKKLVCTTITGFTHFEKCRGVLDLVEYLNAVPFSISIDFYVLGGGLYLEQIKHAAMNQKNVNINLIFLGYVQQTKVIDLLENSDIFLYCSYLDNGPIALLEAIHVGLPVVSNEIGYTPELLTTDDATYTGLYADKDSFVELFRKISEDSIFRDKFILSQYAVAKRSFSTPCVQEQWSGLFYSLANGSRGK